MNLHPIVLLELNAHAFDTLSSIHRKDSQFVPLFSPALADICADAFQRAQLSMLLKKAFKGNQEDSLVCTGIQCETTTTAITASHGYQKHWLAAFIISGW